MGRVWVKALTIIRTLDEHAQRVVFQPGDWFTANKQDIRNWLANDQVELSNPATMNRVLPPECGIVCTTEIDYKNDALDVIFSDPALSFTRTLIWNPKLLLNNNLLPAAFGLLSKWEILVPISDYSMLAADIGTAEDRERTKAIIHDLRVPVYDVRMIFARRCLATTKLLAVYAEEMESGGDDRLAFLRALYVVKPYILALPSIWAEK